MILKSLFYATKRDVFVIKSGVQPPVLKYELVRRNTGDVT